MLYPMAEEISSFRDLSDELYIRSVRSSDRRDIITIGVSGQSLHYPWITPPLTSQTFRNYLKRSQTYQNEGFVVCLQDSDEVVGVINLNDIIRGSFWNCNISYYVKAEHQGKGFMTQGLRLVIDYAVRTLGLHRIEAAIQPSNVLSKKLVQRCGFQYEGLAKQFLFIDGAWCDHERWAILDHRKSLTQV